MSLKIAFITATRDDLFEVGQRLAAGLEPAFLTDPQHPVLASVRGGFNAGKSIIPDAIWGTFGLWRDSLNDPWVCLRSGTILGKPFTCFFINGALYERGLSNAEEIPDGNGKGCFASIGRTGGIGFVQNHQDFEQRRAGIRIWMEGSVPEFYNGERSLLPVSPLLSRFKEIEAETTGNSLLWMRYVEIEIKDEGLLQSARFSAAFNAVAGRFSAISMPSSAVKRKVGMHVA